MSAKQVRKLQALKVSKKGNDGNDGNDGNEDAKESGSDCESTEPAESKACGFAALIGSSDTDSDAADAHDSQIDKPAEMAVEKGPTTEIAAEIAPPSKSKKKKKGKKSQVKKTEDSSEGEELLLEAALVQAQVTAAANSLQLGDDVNCGNSLAMAKPFFNADRERRRLFKMKPSHMMKDGHNSRKGQSLKLRGTTEGHFLHYRRLFIIEPTPDEGWPRPDGCARMVTDSSQCFRIETTPERTKMLLEFASDAASYEPQMVYDFLMYYPFCVEALLVASEMNREGRDHQEAFRLLRRAVYAAECSFNGAFSPFSETQVPMVRGDGCCFLSWPRVRVQLPANDSSWPGWSWLMALWGYMLSLASQGLPRTSLEVCKLILAMTLPHDPTHSLAHLDYFALRAEEYDFLLHFVEKFNPPCALPAQCIMRLDCCLPNFAYSAALAYYLRTDGDACDEASALGTVNVEHLTEPCWVRPRAGSDQTDGPSQAHLALLRAMLLFPGTLRSILDNLGISLNSSASGSPYKLSWSELLERSPLGQKPTLHQQHFLAHALVSDAFVQRCAGFFRGERMLRWLHACAGRLVQMCQSSLFEKELLQARKAWSEAPLAVANALANDYKKFSTSEVGPERKVPVAFENAVNTWLGAPAETPQHRPEAQLVAKAPPEAPPRHAQLVPPPHPPLPPPGGYAPPERPPPPPPAGYALGGLLPPPQPLPKAAPLQLNYHRDEQEDSDDEALRKALLLSEAEERRRLVAEQDEEFRESLAADAARAESAADAALGEGGEGGGNQSLRVPDRESLTQLEAMGFDGAAAVDALRKAGNVEGAVELLTS